jgi:Tol biopolymer transport system component
LLPSSNRRTARSSRVHDESRRGQCSETNARFDAGGAPGWSPNGNQLIFPDNVCTSIESDLFVMDPDGGEITQVTDSPENEISKSWSPDGTRVVADFATIHNGNLSKGDIAVIGVGTGATVNLTNTPGIEEGDPDWSPR